MNFDILLIKIYTHDNMKHVINVLKFLLFSKFYFPFEILSKLLVSSIQQHNHFGDERNLEFSNIKKIRLCISRNKLNKSGTQKVLLCVIFIFFKFIFSILL